MHRILCGIGAAYSAIISLPMRNYQPNTSYVTWAKLIYISKHFLLLLTPMDLCEKGQWQFRETDSRFSESIYRIFKVSSHFGYGRGHV